MDRRQPRLPAGAAARAAAAQAGRLEPAVDRDHVRRLARSAAGVKAGFNGSQLLEFTFPHLHGTDIDAELARQVADVELGRDAMLEPQELALVLGWEQEWRESNKESA